MHANCYSMAAAEVKLALYCANCNLHARAESPYDLQHKLRLVSLMRPTKCAMTIARIISAKLKPTHCSPLYPTLIVMQLTMPPTYAHY